MSPTRRHLMGLAVSTAMLGGGKAGAAAGEAAAVQAPGFYRLRVGRFLVTLVNDGVGTRPLAEDFVRNAGRAEVQAALDAVRQPTETLSTTYTTTLIDDGTRRILIDAGNGEGGPQPGLWQRNLAAAGYTPDQIDIVIASHFHPDHIAGIRRLDGTLAFPRAQLMGPEAEWAFWLDEGRAAAAPEAARRAFDIARRVLGPERQRIELFAGEKELVPGLTALPAPGHTPGHTAFLLADGDERLLVWSDVTNRPELFVRHPTWQVAFDIDGDQAVATRLRFLDMAAGERLRVAGYHFPFPANGWIVKDGQNYSYVPSFWTPML